MNDQHPPELSDETRQLASYVAMVVRNAMENFHHEHLSDDQMKQLNPIVRDAVCTALHAFQNYDRAPEAKRFVDYNLRMIPRYWEAPELLDGYVRMWGKDRPEFNGWSPE